MRETIEEDVAAPLHLTEYEVQVLIGTSINGCKMSPDRVFSLPMAWHRLCNLGLIDRADGLAIITEKGQAVVSRILAALEPAPKPAGGEWVTVPREPTEAMMSVIGGTTLQAKIWKAMLAAAPTPPSADSAQDDDLHRFAVVSSDYAHPFLLGAYPKLENAIKAQCGSPEKWHIFERYAANKGRTTDGNS